MNRAGRIPLQKPGELVHCETRIPNQRPESAFGQFFMVGNREAPVRRVGVSKYDVAAVLPIEFVAGFPE